MVQMFGMWSAEELRAAADIAKEKGVSVRLRADGSIVVGETPQQAAKPVPPAKSTGDGVSTLPDAFSPATLAERWSCSERHVRNLIAQNILGHFHLGGKLMRIPRDEVERFEKTPAYPAKV
ncbi:helix-turn-helix domain-containing protein [Shinella sp.]|uniref:helix-turn-helix domain-containing protein n=1 Tax=Shinella sp. TaxID=1870904 RepID=UPI003F705166